jgi:thioredoxin 1
VLLNQIAREDLDDFIAKRGMPGFSPTQGHIASAVPVLGHAIRHLTRGSFPTPCSWPREACSLGESPVNPTAFRFCSKKTREVLELSIDLDRETYEGATLKSELPMMVDFWVPQCGPCLALMPFVEKLESEFEGKLNVAKVNVAHNRMLCVRLRVMSVPTFIFYKNGEEISRLVGDQVDEKEIRNTVSRLCPESPLNL